MLRTLIVTAALASVPAAADVVQSSPIGFEVSNTATVAAPLEQAWPVVTAPRLWWDKDHTYSEDAANLTLDERPGGCFCEKLPNKGGVEHMRVVYIQPPRMIRMVGALGPLQAEAADGTLAIVLTKEAAGTKIVMNYVAGGYIRAGADKLAPVVDRVLAQQLAGLKAAIERGPAAVAPKLTAGKAKPAPQSDAKPLADIEQTISGLKADGPPAPAPEPTESPR